MPNRLDIEITSQSTESSYTWRSAGAKEPKGTIKASLLPSGVAIGDVLKVEADFMIDGIEITAVLPQKIKKDGPELLELLGTGKETAGVTTSLVKKSNNRKRRKDARVGPKSNKAKDRKRSRSSKARTERKDRKPYRSPRGKRLKPSKKYRNEYIESLPELQKPIAKELSGSTIPNLRRIIEKMDLPEGFPDALLDYAESLNQQLKMAEWMDKATAVENNIAPLICYDIRIPEMTRALVLEHHADLLLHCGAYFRDESFATWHSFATTRAMENQTYLLSINRAGSDYGNSLFCPPWMDQNQPAVAFAEHAEQFRIFQVDPDLPADTRSMYTFLKDRHAKYSL